MTAVTITTNGFEVDASVIAMAFGIDPSSCRRGCAGAMSPVFARREWTLILAAFGSPFAMPDGPCG